jgi:hypothetical protein
MQSIGREYKAEIRRSLIQTLENIIINHGSIFSLDVWMLLLQKILISMLKHSSDIFTKSIKQKTFLSSDVEDSQELKPQKDSEKIMMSTPAFGGGNNQPSASS